MDGQDSIVIEESLDGRLDATSEFIRELVQEGEIEIKDVDGGVAWLLSLSMAEKAGMCKNVLAIDGGCVVGHAGFMKFIDNAPSAHNKLGKLRNGTRAGKRVEKGASYGELFIAVKKSHRRRGIGRKMLGTLGKVAEKDGLNGLIAYCRKGNKKGISFYRACGFSEIESTENFTTFSIELSKGIDLKTLLRNRKTKSAHNVITMVEDNSRINELQEKKKALIDRVRAATKKLKYKKIELEAVSRLIENYDEREVQRLQRMLKGLEFKVQTTALTSKTEKDLVKKIMAIEKKLAKWRPMIKAKRRKKYIEEDIKGLEEEIEEVEEKLKEIREELNKLYRDRKSKEMAEKKGVKFAEEVEDMVSMGDVIVFEEEDKKK